MTILDLIEPDSMGCLRGQDPNNMDPAHYIGVMLTSIAISQKRQADSMDRLEAKPDFGDVMAAMQPNG